MQVMNTPDPTPRYWFAAKKYGWGWSHPATWEGWVVLAGYLALTIPVTYWLFGMNPIMAYGFLGIMILVLLLVAWIKGEPPRWRWGGK